jgi:diguanylate cyclase (GGDEF)-like protein
VRGSGKDGIDYRLRPGEGLAGWIALHGEPVIVPNTLEDPRVTHIPGTPRREESMIGAPLVFENRVQGVITLSKLGAGQFDENALRLLEIVAGQAAIVFDRARLYDELRMEAITDPLTKLYNRRYLIERLKEAQARAMRNEHDLSAIMLDMDHFKQVNDRFGHDAGDVVLQTVAGIIRGEVRTEDIVARYGGEEFCVLLPDVPTEEAEIVAERLRYRIGRTLLPQEAGIDHVTVSVGVAHLYASDSGTQLFSRADAAMYHGKHLGGNAVYVSDGESIRPLAVSS